jgi:formyltetrahydrofolate-dependent phosphoribosylglycinamide formyltransferase
MASGTGTLFEALLDSGVGADVVALVTDQPNARAVNIAQSREIEVHKVPLSDFDSRESWESELLEQVENLEPDLIVAAGFMRILSPAFVDHFPDRIVNSHPSLLPQYPGAHAVRDAIEANAAVTGCTIHFIDHGVDTGEIIAQAQVKVQPGESEAELHERIKTVERTLLPQSVDQLLIGRLGKGLQ